MSSSTALHNQPSDPRLASSRELELAQKGEAGAIAALINRLLQAQGITAMVQRQGDRLVITLKAAALPPQTQASEFIRNGLVKLQPAGIRRVEIAGQAQETDQPSWSTTLELQPDSGPTAAIAPSPPASPILPHQRSPFRLSSSKVRLLMAGSAIAATVLFSLALIAYCLHQLANPALVAPTAAPTGLANRTITLSSTQNSKLALTGVNWKANQAKQYNLVGTLRNNTGQLYTYVKIEFELYNGAGERVGDSMAIVENVGAYQTKAFETVTVPAKAMQARVKSITGF